ncbi:GNAT family N-acetyltransferase [Anaerobacillus sp. 1_MG-2023]|uniref:GNAT family N-acetyltransferase n=1 Tax=Anaerobacillus sp. 1_MG-2023 TaxID=3062655 RepID=UPI0026E3062D|nr:GNAT family N-acetyltransferase [Anaerobacillus sp. 1_MG-2023]MDO6654394.1 GNAT family N-acetyltransferase [Anaerobacillus sp. 1_MG-2023]
MISNYQVIDRFPTSDEYVRLCLSVGWNNMNFSVAEKAVHQSIYATTVSYGDEVIGMARIVGDGGMYFYIQDFVVHPMHQGKGVGKMLMDQLFSYLKEHAPTQAFIGLFATEEGSHLYKQFGFEQPGDMNGMFRLTPIES